MVTNGLWHLMMVVVIIFVGRIAVNWAVTLLGKMMRKSNQDEILINFISSIVKALLLLLVFIAALSQLGVDTTSLIALIGAAGLAIGLALQNSLQNFAAGVMMITFRPFKLGDFIEAAGVVGIVEKISIFSTLLKTNDNREIIVPNGQIYSDAITNYSARDTRRIDMVFGISYDDDILVAKKLMESILIAHELVLDEPAPAVAVTELADSSVNFNVRPWVKTENYWGVRSELIEQIKLAFDDNNISIPYPHLTIEKENSDS